MRDYGSWLWLVIDVGFVALLAAAILWGTIMWRRRSRRQAEHTERATKELYRRGEQAGK